MPHKQPDFSAIFAETFKGPPRTVTYTLRDGPNLPHDVAFMNSLIHDARMENAGSEAKQENVTLRINRDCWELGYTEHSNGAELHVADASLEVKGVCSIDWYLPETSAKEPWIDRLGLDQSYYEHDKDSFSLQLWGHDWRCDLILNREKWSFRLRDLEVPYLWSKRHGVGE